MIFDIEQKMHFLPISSKWRNGFYCCLALWFFHLVILLILRSFRSIVQYANLLQLGTTFKTTTLLLNLGHCSKRLFWTSWALARFYLFSYIYVKKITRAASLKTFCHAHRCDQCQVIIRPSNRQFFTDLTLYSVVMEFFVVIFKHSPFITLPQEVFLVPFHFLLLIWVWGATVWTGRSRRSSPRHVSNFSGRWGGGTLQASWIT